MYGTITGLTQLKNPESHLVHSIAGDRLVGTGAILHLLTTILIEVRSNGLATLGGDLIGIGPFATTVSIWASTHEALEQGSTIVASKAAQVTHCRFGM
jgi:hypothetical protein